MLPLVLAVEVDLVSLGALAVTALTGLGAVLRVLWNAGVQLTGYAQAKIEPLYEEHVGLVKDMRANVPKVADTMEALATSQKVLVETQTAQCEQLKQLADASDRHEQLHAETGEKLDKIIVTLENHTCKPS